MLTRVLELADYTGFEKRRVAAARDGRLRGIGIACYVESSGVARRASPARSARASASTSRLDPHGARRRRAGPARHAYHGQGHETSFAQILSARLGVPLDKIEIVEGDTDSVPHGTGTFGSRSIAIGGSALHARR